MSPYQHPSWHVAVKHWKRAQARRGHLVCARCGGRIGRTARRGPDSLDVGHIVAVVICRQLGWTVEEINAIGNTQPEHERCNRTAGAKLGNELRARARPAGPVTTREW